MGYLYILQSGEYLKIGISKNHPRQRVKQLQTGSAQEIKLLKFYRRKDYKQLEKYLHQKFRRRRIRGEWFNVELETVTSIIEKDQTMFQRIMGFIAYLWTMAIGLFVLFLIALVIDGIFLGGNLITLVLDMLY